LNHTRFGKAALLSEVRTEATARNNYPIQNSFIIDFTETNHRHTFKI